MGHSSEIGRGLKTDLKHANEYAAKLVRRIEASSNEALVAERAGNATRCKRLRRKAAYLGRQLTSSLAGKLVATNRAFKSRRFSHIKLTPAQLKDVAASISVAAPGVESLRIVAKNKKIWPEFRPIFALGPVETARQFLLDMSLRPQLPTLPNQYLTRNGGRHAAVEQVRALLKTGKYRFVETLDLKDFYPSIDREWLKRTLPIGENVTSNTILLENHHSRARVSGCGLYRHPALTETTVLLKSRLGLLQGAASSPTISEAIVTQLLRVVTLSCEVALVNYADNFVVLASSRAELKAAVQSLQDAFERHPAGEMRLIGDGIRRVCDGLTFLGYRHKRVRGRDASVPIEKNTKKFVRTVNRLIVRTIDGDATPHALKRYVLSWLAAFRHWDGRYSFASQVLRPLRRLVEVRSTYNTVLELGVRQFEQFEATICQ